MRLHIGKPRNPAEWRAWDRRLITTCKSNLPAHGRARLINHFDLRWWFGLSGSTGLRPWFIGLMCFRPHKSSDAEPL